MRQALPENVAEHSFDVAVLTHALCTIAFDVYGREIDTGRAVTLALFHDVSEVITGDIPTPVKHGNPRILHSLREMEGQANEQLLAMAPAQLRQTYAALIAPVGGDADLVVWVKAADKLAAYLKCLSELAAGNREFAVAAKQLRGQVEAFDLPEIAYFLAQFAPSFEKTLDEISE
jgi:5'-deoxynucleotidase